MEFQRLEELFSGQWVVSGLENVQKGNNYLLFLRIILSLKQNEAPENVFVCFCFHYQMEEVGEDNSCPVTVTGQLKCCKTGSVIGKSLELARPPSNSETRGRREGKLHLNAIGSL